MRKILLLILFPTFSFGFGLPQLAHLHDDFTPGVTTYLAIGSGALIAENIESLAQIPYYYSGTMSKLWVNIPINSLTSISTCTMRINGMNGNEVVKIGAGATGTFTDNTHTDTIPFNALVDAQCAIGKTGTSFRIQGVMTQFVPDIPVYAMKWMAGTWPIPFTGTGQTNGFADFYEVPIGLQGNGAGQWANQTESNVYYLMHSSGTFLNMTINVSSNTRSVTIPFNFRKNGVNQMTINVVANSTGIYTDAVDSVHVVAGDTVTYSIGTSAGSDGNLIASTYLSTDFISDSNAIELGEGFSGGHQNSAGGNQQMPYMSCNSWGGNEYLTPAYAAGTIGNQSVYVLSNTLSGTSVFNLNKNGTALNGNITIPVGVSGTVKGTGSDSISVGDLIDYTQVAQAGTGSANFATFGSVLTTTTTARTPSDPILIPVFPTDNVWDARIDTLTVSSSNTVWMSNAQTTHNISVFVGTTYGNEWLGLPYNLICGGVTPNVPVSWAPGNFSNQSDTIPVAGLPIPSDAIEEGDPASLKPAGFDYHLILVDTCTPRLYEMYIASRTIVNGNWNGQWNIIQLSTWQLTSDALRPDTWTSADAAGLPILPGLLRWDEVQTAIANGTMVVPHALRFTLALTYGPHIWPARHDANTGSPGYPPFGMRVRLQSTYNVSGYSTINQVILNTLKKYGMFMADNGTAWQIAGAPNSNWNDSDLHNLTNLTGANFEVVNEDGLMVSSNTMQVNGYVPPIPNPAPKIWTGKFTVIGGGSTY
jgi:hypothetical protein